MIKKAIYFFLIIFVTVLGIVYFFTEDTNKKPNSNIAVYNTPTPTTTTKNTYNKLNYRNKHSIEMAFYNAQTFNNCGPATLTMVLNYYNKNTNQQIIGNSLRPYQNSTGDNDDKSVYINELVDEAKKYNLNALYRPSGSIDLVKYFINNDIPIILKTWLNDKEDIAHYIIIKGYDEKSFLVDDSYNGKNIILSEDYLLKIWQPFNYEYLVIYDKKLEDFVQTALKDNIDFKTAWKSALQTSPNEQKNSELYTASIFNSSVSYYYLENYTKSIQMYEKVKEQVPSRMLWYQIEPIKAYYEMGNYQKVFEITNQILNNNNKAFSELYVIRAKSFIKQGNNDQAKKELESAIKYNQNYQEPKDLLNSL